MNSLRHSALAAYTTLVAPYRRARRNWLATQSLCPISVLFYHRVADHHANDWTISIDRFRRHVEFCHANFEMIDLAEVQRRVRQRDSTTPAASFTFDDGYADNCEVALPLLVERNIPCTYFVTTENVRSQTPFAHDLKAGQRLAVNSVHQLRELAEAGVEIGCHTRSHIDFSRVFDPDVVRQEIFGAKDELEQMIGRPIRYFAFPFGMPRQLTQVAIEAIHQAGFEGFCSAYGGYNVIGRDDFHIRRCHGDPQLARVKNWLTYDPRKVRNEPAIRYFLPPQRSFAANLHLG